MSNGIKIYFLSDNINTILPDSEFRFAIMASVAQDEVTKLSERVRFSITSKEVVKNLKLLKVEFSGSVSVVKYQSLDAGSIIYEGETIKFMLVN